MPIKHKTMQKLELMLSEAETRRAWGTIEVELRNGRPTLVRQTIQTKLTDEDTPDVNPNQRTK